MGREGLRKELGFTPAAPWSDVTATWKDGETLTVQYTLPGDDKPRTVERKVSAADWQRF